MVNGRRDWRAGRDDTAPTGRVRTSGPPAGRAFVSAPAGAAPAKGAPGLVVTTLAGQLVAEAGAD